MPLLIYRKSIRETSVTPKRQLKQKRSHSYRSMERQPLLLWKLILQLSYWTNFYEITSILDMHQIHTAYCLCLAVPCFQAPHPENFLSCALPWVQGGTLGQKKFLGCFAYCQSSYSLPRMSRRISRSVSRFFIVSRLSNFFLPFTRAISTLIFLPLLYTEIGTIVKLLFFSFPANSLISLLVSKSLRLRSGS